MTKVQLASIIFSLILVLILYFGCERRAPEFRGIEKSRSLNLELVSIDNLLQEAKPMLSASDLAQVNNYERFLHETLEDSSKIEAMKTLSGKWYELGHPAIAGHYAYEIALLNPLEESWSIAGTTYSICVQRAEDQELKDYCTTKAVNAFENAISVNPSNIDHKINLALAYVENPATDNPMQGIQMLLQLRDTYPENVGVLTNLARLAIRTGQFDRAQERLRAALKLEPNNVIANCLMASTLQALNQNAEAEVYMEKCNQQ